LPAWLFPMAATLLLGALIIWTASQQRKPVHEQVLVPAPIATPTPALISRPAPRAVIVKLPPPRAFLVRLPHWRIGEERSLLMPYGLSVLGRLRGNLASTDMLPSAGNALGDVWMVGDIAYVWLVAPNSASAQWIDP
jgi:hypothetical protein